jgi:hypothetical protein
MRPTYTRPVWLVVATFAMVLGMLGAVVPAATAQESTIPENAPVDIHSGSCEDFLTEPAYDGGAITPTTLGEVFEDDRFQSGILVDEQLGASGVDLNADDALQPEEVVAPTGEEAPVGFAEADLESDVNTGDPYVVAVHSSPDQYETVLACGSLTNAEEADGRRVVRLQSVGDAQFFGYSVLEEDGASIATYLFQPGTPPAETAATAPTIEGHPVDIHTGTCTDWTTEPAFDVGDMLETNVAAPDEQEPGDMEGEVPAGAEELGPVFKIDNETEFGGDELIEDGGPLVVAVHQSAENYEELVACGTVLPIIEDDDLYVILQPVGESNQTGFLKISREGGEASGYLWSCEPLEPKPAEPTPTPAPTQTPTPEPSPTPTEEAVIVATAVVTEVVQATEVVPAPTATALAEQGGGAVVFELGEESAGALTSQAGETLIFNNTSDVERVFRVEDLEIEETIPAGEQVEVQLPDDAEAGTYTYQVLEGDETIFEHELTVE